MENFFNSRALKAKLDERQRRIPTLAPLSHKGAPKNLWVMIRSLSKGQLTTVLAVAHHDNTLSITSKSICRSERYVWVSGTHDKTPQSADASSSIIVLRWSQYRRQLLHMSRPFVLISRGPIISSTFKNKICFDRCATINSCSNSQRIERRASGVATLIHQHTGWARDLT